MNAPSWRNAVFSAVNEFASTGAVFARNGSTARGSSWRASARLVTQTPSGRFRFDERDRENLPFTNTSSLPSNFPNTTGSSFSGARPFPGISAAGVNRVLASGATFVYFHISCLRVGNPRAPNFANASRRVFISHGGSPAKSSRSSRSKSERYGSRGSASGTASPPPRRRRTPPPTRTLASRVRGRAPAHRTSRSVRSPERGRSQGRCS